MLKSIRRYFFRRRLGTHAGSISTNAEALERIRTETFPEADFDRFSLLWCELAEILGTDAGGLRLDRQLNSNSCSKGQLEDISYLLSAETVDKPPPDSPPADVRQVLRYILGS